MAWPSLSKLTPLWDWLSSRVSFSWLSGRLANIWSATIALANTLLTLLRNPKDVPLFLLGIGKSLLLSKWTYVVLFIMYVHHHGVMQERARTNKVIANANVRIANAKVESDKELAQAAAARKLAENDATSAIKAFEANCKLSPQVIEALNKIR